VFEGVIFKVVVHERKRNPKVNKDCPAVILNERVLCILLYA
jgi:hypothetical protein